MIRLVTSNNGKKPPWVMDLEAHVVLWFHPAAPGPAGSPVAFAGPPAFTPIDQSPYSTPPRKYQLQMRLDLGNPNRFPITLDAVVFRFRRLDGGGSMDDVIEQVTIWADDDKLITKFFYEPGAAVQAEPDEEPREVTIAGRRGIILPRVPLGGLHSKKNEHGPTRISGHVYHEGREVAYPATADLPSHSAIPVIDNLQSDEPGLPLRFVRQAPNS